MWGGRFEAEPSKLLRALNDSFAFDRELFAEDVQGSIAWARAIGECGVLTASEVETIVNALQSIPHPAFGHPLPSPGEGQRSGGEGSPEDIHSYVEAKLFEKIGPLAGKLHTGRSRNDQVATDLKLWLKNACNDAVAQIASLRATLERKAVAESETKMPGYTHSKQAEPITFALWCRAYVEMLTRDLSRFHDASVRGDECPLGSGALAGTPLPVDREKLAKSLGFSAPTRNSLDAVSDRDFAAEYLFAATMTLSHLSHLAEDLIFYTTDEAAYAELPDAMATGSSRMPQKKNPDVLELARGHAGRAIGELTGLLSVLKGLPLAYDKDLQLDKEPLFRIRNVLALVLPAIAELISGLNVDRARMAEAATSDQLVATSYADKLAATGIPFRQAHEIVGNAIRSGTLHQLVIPSVVEGPGGAAATSASPPPPSSLDSARDDDQ
ncbi:MAG TPA: argininosuccinate lyase [Thermoanaerobaculia bacterium]|nr:argininosuccinate lyase [Thermoanaerobaculia bacterium]